MPILSYGLKWSFDGGMSGRLAKGPNVRLNEMHGIYVIYDDEDNIIYVGKSNASKRTGIYGRLVAHRNKEQKEEWGFDTYSWFGVLDIGLDGTLSELSVPHNSDKLTRTLEALLIYLLEPTENRNGGEYKKIPRYKQVIC